MMSVCGFVCVGVYVQNNVDREGERERERSPEEYWPYGMVDITSLNKRLMPQAKRGWAEKWKERKKRWRRENILHFSDGDAIIWK